LQDHFFVHFGTWSLFCDVGSLSSHKILSWQILSRDIKVNVHLELHVYWGKQAFCWLLVLLHKSNLLILPLNLENLLDPQDWIKTSSTCMWCGGTLINAWWRKVAFNTIFVLVLWIHVQKLFSTKEKETLQQSLGKVHFSWLFMCLKYIMQIYIDELGSSFVLRRFQGNNLIFLVNC
jgi:hypothetical protein